MTGFRNNFTLYAAKYSLFANCHTRVDVNEVRGNVIHHKTGYEDLQGQYSYSSTLSLTSVLDGAGCQRSTPTALTSGKRTGTKFTGG